MQARIDRILSSPALWLAARLFLAVVFVSGGLAKVIDIEGSLAETRAAGLEPAGLFNAAAAIALLFGSLLLLLDRALFLGALILTGFLALTILLVHSFWQQTGPQAQISLYFALEHISLVGGLLLAAIVSTMRRRILPG